MLIAVFAYLPSSNLGAENLGGSNLLQQTHTLCQQSYRNLSESNRQENFTNFRRLLPALATIEKEVLGSTPEEKTLLRIAREAGARPALLDELLEYYGHRHRTDVAQPHVLLPPRLQATHTTETYRVAWEALLIAPPSHEIWFMEQRATSTEALWQIGSPESLPVLELAFSFTCAEGVVATDGSRAATKRLQILVCLSHITTRESLEVMLRCLAQAEAVSAEPLRKDAYGFNLRDRIVRFLTEQHNQTGDKWQEILRSFPKENLTANQRELLERATRSK